MDDLERYVDILFADYRQYEHAQKLRIAMLNDLLLKKENLQMQGRSESDAIREVLASLDDFGAPAEGNYLVFSDMFRHDEAMSRLLWLIVGVVLSVPTLIVGQYWLSIVFVLALCICFFLTRKDLRDMDSNKVNFYDMDELKATSGKYWKYWLIGSVVYLVLAYLWNTGRLPFIEANFVAGPLGSAQKLFRYYPPLVFMVIPLWAADRPRLLIKNEMGATMDMSDVGEADTGSEYNAEYQQCLEDEE